MVGANPIRQRAFAVDMPNAYHGRGRVLMFANNPVYRWQNHAEFNMVFNSILNWNDVPGAARATQPISPPAPSTPAPGPPTRSRVGSSPWLR
jgi:hypothetical protein